MFCCFDSPFFLLFGKLVFSFFSLWLVSSFLFHQSTYVCPAFVRLDLLFGFGHHQIQIPVKHVCLVILTYSMTRISKEKSKFRRRSG